MSYLRDFMSITRYIKSTFDVHGYGHQIIRASALADLVSRAGVVDLGVALLVGDGVVEADPAETLVDPIHAHRVVRTADVRVGAAPFDGQLVVVSADGERLSIGAVELGARADRAVVDGVADLDLTALGAECGGGGVGVAAVRAAAGEPDHDGGSHTDHNVRAHGSSLPLSAMRTRPITRECGQSGSSCPVPAHGPRQPAHRLCRTRSGRTRTR